MACLWIIILLNICSRYGAPAGEGTMHATGTARNVALVYIDMKGIGRKALMKKAAKDALKTAIRSSRKK
jgi:spartin